MLLNKKKKANIFAALLIAAVTASAAVPISAATLTDNSNEESTEVTAKILGEDEPDPGSVSYIITIPDKIDFGQLVKPATNADNYKEVDFTVTATKIEGFNSSSNWGVGVQVRDSIDYDFDAERYKFSISQKTVSHPDASSTGNNNFDYSFFINNSSTPITNNIKDSNGIYIAFFNAAGQSVPCKLKLNQNQLYGRNIEEIAGEYSGSMIFHSSVKYKPANLGN